MKTYEEYRGSRPFNLLFNFIESGIPRWRLHIFEKGTAPSGGDREILMVENKNKEDCLSKAAGILRKRIESEQEASKKAV